MKPDASPRICVIVPVFNHGRTVGDVVRQARALLPVIAVNDGSTDDTPARLAEQGGITVVALDRNQGKGAALRAGFEEARRQGFTHAITIDADGQHPASALPEFIAECKSHPDAVITGTRSLKKEGAPWPRRFSNNLSTFWFKIETGVPLTDTQCGYRVYPLEAVSRLCLRSGFYAFELEVLVKAAWAGIPVLGLPISADYKEPTSRISHFHPFRDMVAISRMHWLFSMQSFCVPPGLRKLSVTGQLRELSAAARLRTVLKHLFAEHTDTPGRFSAAVGLGLFCGIAPIWGFQMIAAAALAHKLRLNKAIALTASNISIPIIAPFIFAASLWLGHYLRTGSALHFDASMAVSRIPLYFAEWFFGSVVLAGLAGALGMLVAWLLARAFKTSRKAAA